jgi:hypothetical protein
MTRPPARRTRQLSRGQGADSATPNHGNHGPQKPCIDRLRSPTDTGKAGKTHARAAAPDHAYYATVKDRKNSKRAALSEARKLVRQACHILTELGDDALTAA